MNALIIQNPNTLSFSGKKAYDSRINLFNKWLEGREVTHKNVNEYFDQLVDCSSSTQRLTKTALKKAIVGTGQITDLKQLYLLEEFFKTLKTSKQDQKVYSEEVLTKKELAILINKAKEENLKMGLIIEVLALTGLRVSELINVKLSDISVNNKFAYVKVLGKGKKERRVFLPVDLYVQILALRPEVYLFENIQKGKFSRQYVHRIVRRLGKDILGKDIHPHSFRHSFATIKIREKGSVKAVSNYLGHSTTAITETMYNHDELKPEEIQGFLNM